MREERMNDKVRAQPDIDQAVRRSFIAKGDELSPEWFPDLQSISPAFIYQMLPHPLSLKSPEYAYVPQNLKDGKRNSSIEVQLAVSQWNLAWEAGQLRYEMFEEKLPEELKWLEKFADKNIYLLPRTHGHRYYSYVPLFHLLPRRTLNRFRLPLLKRGTWPHITEWGFIEGFLPSDFDLRLSRAFACHIWPLIDSGSSPSAFSEREPLKLLAHNLDFWLPYAHQAIEDQLRAFGPVPIEDQNQSKLIEEAKKKFPSEILIDRPLYGGPVWRGEEGAWDVTKEILEKADSGGRLRGIIDAVRSHRVEEDFSPRWSYAREDFERRLYRKRSKIKIRFVELDTIPVHGPESELHENLLWEDFLALLDAKEREIVILIRSGETKVGEISKLLGYANHSPVSKALARIRRKALEFLG
jgi:hypothetical protein